VIYDKETNKANRSKLKTKPQIRALKPTNLFLKG